MIELPGPSGDDKTSLVFSTLHERGALVRALQILDRGGINLCRIESRPRTGETWQYVFFVDLEGHVSERAVSNALSALKTESDMVKVFGSYLVPRTGGLNVGVSGIFNSGAPLTALAANPVFDNGGEIPEGPRGSGIQTVKGFKHRTDFEYNVDLHADYAFRLPGGKRIQAIVDVFNVFDIDQVTAFDNFTELSFSVPNPDFGKIRGFQDPLQVRIGARFHF